jgi:class 3 adenylate cyclase
MHQQDEENDTIKRFSTQHVTLDIDNVGSEKELDELTDTQPDTARAMLHDNLGSLVSSTSKIGDDTTELDEMLNNEHIQKGLMGPIERLPLWIKLSLMIIVSTVGMIVFGALLIESESKNIKVNRKIYRASEAMSSVGDLIHELQTERARALLFLSGTTTSFYYSQQVAIADKLLVSYENILKHHQRYNSVYKKQISVVDTLKQTLKNIRSRVASGSITVDSTLVEYSDVLSQFVNMFTAYISQSSQTGVAPFNVLVRLKEILSITQIFISVQLSKDSIDSGSLNQFTGYLGQTTALRNMFTDTAEPSILFDFHKIFPLDDSDMDQLIEQIQNNEGESSIGAQAWYSVNEIRLDKMRKLEQLISGSIIKESKHSLDRSITRLTIIVVFIVLFWIGNIISAVIFSKTISGPWERMIHIQNITVKKFIPKHLLKMLKVYRLADLTLGKVSQKELTVSYIQIKDFTNIIREMKPEEIYNFLNRFYEKIGKVIRSHNGYIDRFVGHKILVVYPSNRSSMHTVFELQKVIEDFNGENKQNGISTIQTGISLNSGQTMVGTLGENDRIDGAITGETVDVTEKLQTLTQGLQANILTTGVFLNRLKGSTAEACIARPLGYTHVPGKQGRIKVYELIDKNDKKADTIDQCKEVLKLQQSFDYDKAIEIVQKILQENPEDLPMQRILYSLKQDKHILEDKLTHIKVVIDIMHTTDVWPDFEKYCQDERSEENIDFWHSLNTYTKIKTLHERIKFIRVIYQKFLSDDAPRKVNTSKQLTINIAEAIAEYDLNGAEPSMQLFAKLRTDIEGLMNDTFSRYKRTERYKDIVKKALPLHVIHIQDSDNI